MSVMKGIILIILLLLLIWGVGLIFTTFALIDIFVVVFLILSGIVFIYLLKLTRQPQGGEQ